MNAVDGLGETALHRSAVAGQTQSCRVLLTHGADPTLRSFDGYTAVEVASESVQRILQGMVKLAIGNLHMYREKVCKTKNKQKTLAIGNLQVYREIGARHPTSTLKG